MGLMGRSSLPDGHALWRDHDILTGMFAEFDRGGEPLATLVKKLAPFDLLAADGGPAYPVLFSLGSIAREDALHDAFACHGHSGPVPVATTVRDPHGPGPTAPAWALVGDEGPLRTLAQLPFHHGNPDSPNRRDFDL